EFGMIETNFEQWENRVRTVAAEMAYPPTPDIAAGVRERLAAGKRPQVVRPWYSNRLAWAVTAVLLIAALLLAVPQARAAIFEFFQIGSIRIFPADPTATPIIEETADEESEGVLLSPTAEPTTLPAFSVADLAGETTLADLESELGDAVLLPEYPAGVGDPDKVYLQNQVGQLGILVWLQADSTDKAWAVLHILMLDQGAFGAKFMVESLEATEVNGQPAYWVQGEHLLSFYDANGQISTELTHLVEGNALIWTVDKVTYRLETVLSLEEAVRMAESMR
ncbi:MAG: hypothetical protein WAM60_25785, partial [Candidatus Promineifilaceae bacterium]